MKQLVEVSRRQESEHRAYRTGLTMERPDRTACRGLTYCLACSARLKVHARTIVRISVRIKTEGLSERSVSFGAGQSLTQLAGAAASADTSSEGAIYVTRPRQSAAEGRDVERT